MRYNTALIIIATGNYDQFVEPLLNSARIHFMPEDNLTFFVFTDKTRDYGEDCVIIPTKHAPWPSPTIHRYRHITNSSGLFKSMDYLFYIDADSLFVDKVGREILDKELTVVLHPGFYSFPGTGSWGDDEKSTSYTPKDKRKIYCCGGFWGSNRMDFLTACYRMKTNIDTDESNSVTAIYHDETHLNKLVSEWPHKALDPSYMMVEQIHLRQQWKINHFKPRILALAKDHQKIRS